MGFAAFKLPSRAGSLARSCRKRRYHWKLSTESRSVGDGVGLSDSDDLSEGFLPQRVCKSYEALSQCGWRARGS